MEASLETKYSIDIQSSQVTTHSDIAFSHQAINLSAAALQKCHYDPSALCHYKSEQSAASASLVCHYDLTLSVSRAS